MPSQEWQYDCRESDAGSLTCSIDQQPCGGGCDDGTTGSTDDQCNQCLSDGHKGLDGGTTCDGSCTPGDVSDPCFKGFTQSPPPPPPPPPPPSAKVQAEKTRDSTLAGITDESLKRKAKLLADAAIADAVKKLTAKLTAPDADKACSDYYEKAGLSKELGACVATAPAGDKNAKISPRTACRARFFSSAEVDEYKLTKARDALQGGGHRGDARRERGYLRGARGDRWRRCERRRAVQDATPAAASLASSREEKPPLPPPPPPPPSPPPPKLVLDEEDATPRLGAGSAAFASACAFLTVAMFA